MQSRGTYWLLLLAVLCCAACRQHEAPVNDPADVARYAMLPGLTGTHNEELQAELARLLAAKMTPLQLMDKAGESASNQPRLEAAPDDLSAAARLDVIFPPNFRDAARKHLDKVWPTEGFTFTPATLHVVSTLTRRYRIKREQYEKALSEPGFRLLVNHSLGLSADTSYLDAVAIGQRLVGLTAAELIADGDPEAAIQPLRLMFRLSEILSDEKSITSRGSAAARRGEALQVLEGIAQHPAATPAVHHQLQMLLDQQLERWPEDADAWIGDRAQGLHTYELVRGGYLLSLLTYDELREYRDAIGIEQLAEVVAQNIDQDELFYLRTMQDVIDACQKPHYERGELFQQVEANLELLRGGDAYPFVADQLLLLQLDRGSRMMAFDRARCEAWALALRIANGNASPEPSVNPLTGDEFFVEVSESRIVIDAIDPEGGVPAAIVPRVAPDATAPRVGSPLRRESF